MYLTRACCGQPSTICMKPQARRCGRLASDRFLRRPVIGGLQNGFSACKTFHSSTPDRYRPLEALAAFDIDAFRALYFKPEKPVVLPRAHFQDIPAFQKWFVGNDLSMIARDRPAARLNLDYLQRYAQSADVPVELTELSRTSIKGTAHDEGSQTAPDRTVDAVSFQRAYMPLSLFLEWMREADPTCQTTRLYLAQCQLFDLPAVLRDDIHPPDLVTKAGRGDIYDTNIWIGHPPTYTPLHRDPNPNLFVQLAGRKVVRLLAPTAGQALFSSVRGQLGQSGGKDAAVFRGEEMMQGQERALLDERVWGDSALSAVDESSAYEACLEAGDGLFIPKGWWHSIKGVGDGVTASVSLFF